MLSKTSSSFALVASAAIVLATFGQVSAANTSGLIFIDSPTRGFLRDVQVEEAPPLALSQDTISVLLSSFLGLAPSTIVTPQAAQQVRGAIRSGLGFRASLRSPTKSKE
jgi:hypothetical protein